MCAGIRVQNAGAVLRQARLDAGLSIHDLGRKAGWNYTTISKCENNLRGMSCCMLEDISEALGFHPLYMLLKCIHYKYLSCAEEFKCTDLMDQLHSLNTNS